MEVKGLDIDKTFIDDWEIKKYYCPPNRFKKSVNLLAIMKRPQIIVVTVKSIRLSKSFFP